MRQTRPTGWQTHRFVINFSPCSADVCHSHHVRLSHAFQIAEVQDGAVIQGLIHQGLYLSRMGHSGGRVHWFSCWKRTLAQIPRCIYRQSFKERVEPGKLKLKSQIKEIVHPKKMYLLEILSPSGRSRCRQVCFFIGTDLEKCSIMSLAHLWILYSEWVPSEFEFKQLIKTSQ